MAALSLGVEFGWVGVVSWLRGNQWIGKELTWVDGVLAVATVVFVLRGLSRDSLLASVSPETKPDKCVVSGKGKEGRNLPPFEPFKVLAALFFESIETHGGQALSPALGL